MNTKKTDFPTIAMNIILPAGNAKIAALNSMNELMNGNPTQAEKLLNDSKTYIKEAHRVQTELLQELARSEFNNEETEPLPMLFIHAQDTLMTVMTEVELIEKMNEMYTKLNREIEACRK